MATSFTILGHPKHIATFRGLHNSAKSKVLIVLHIAMFIDRVTTGYNVQELHQLSGVNFSTLSAHIGQWHRWGYVSRRAKANDQGKPVFYYWLGSRGKAFVEIRIPAAKLKEYIKEIQAHRAKQKEEVTHGI